MNVWHLRSHFWFWGILKFEVKCSSPDLWHLEMKSASDLSSDLERESSCSPGLAMGRWLPLWEHTHSAGSPYIGTCMQCSCKHKAMWFFPPFYRWETDALNRPNSLSIVTGGTGTWTQRHLAPNPSKCHGRPLLDTASPCIGLTLAAWYFGWRQQRCCG